MWIRTLQQARRVVKIVIGFTLLLIGLLMWFTPGPGTAAIIGGLVILSAEFVWARRLLNRLKEKSVQLRDAVMSSNSSPKTEVAPAPPKQN